STSSPTTRTSRRRSGSASVSGATPSRHGGSPSRRSSAPRRRRRPDSSSPSQDGEELSPFRLHRRALACLDRQPRPAAELVGVVIGLVRRAAVVHRLDLPTLALD